MTGLNGPPCTICGEPTKKGNRTGVHFHCAQKARALAEIGYRPEEDVDALMQRSVDLETAPPWVRHPVAWDCVKVQRNS